MSKTLATRYSLKNAGNKSHASWQSNVATMIWLANVDVDAAGDDEEDEICVKSRRQAEKQFLCTVDLDTKIRNRV